MQNFKENFVARMLSWVLAIVMIVTLLPVGIFAEVEPANWVDDDETARYWPIPSQGKIVKVSTAEPVKNPSLRFIGGYTRPDGREVLRLAFGGYSGSTTAVWERLILKPDANLNEMIDWNESRMGKKRPEQAVNNHDGYNFNKDWVKFSSISAMQGGSGNLHMMDLGYKGTKTVKTGLQGVHYEAPIDLVLNKGQSIKDLKTNPLIQMRLTDSDLKRIYSTTIESNKEVPYSSYTMSTFIPIRVNLSEGIIRTDVVRNYENIFQSASSYIKYNEEKGYIDVYTRRTHGNVESNADNGGSFNSADNRNKGNYGFRQTFDASLIDILKPQDESDTVAQIFTSNDKDEVRNASSDVTVAKPENRIDYSLNDIKKSQDNTVGILEVSNNDPNKTFMPTGSGLTTYGDSTVVRYFIDKDKLKQKFGGTDVVAYEFFSTVFAKNETGVEEFISPKREQDIDLKRGDKIHIRFDGRRDLISSGTFDTQGSVIQIGDDQFSIGLRTTADKAVYTGTGTVWNDNYMKSMEVWIPFDIKIKKDTPVKILSRKTKLQEVSPGMTVRFEYSDQDDSGNTIKKNISYRFERPLVDGYTRNDKGEIFKDGQKINNPTDELFIDNKQPLVTSRQANFAGGILARTADYPDVDEIFTDSEAISGRTKYDSANIYLYDKAKDDTSENSPKDENRIATITASDKKEDMVVNGGKVAGYNWSSSDIKKDEDKLDPKLWAVKDIPLYLTNQDVLQVAIENDKTVVEQVQAKVVFDLNGGKAPLEVKSYQGIDKEQTQGTEFAYVTKRSAQEEAITRIAPLNNKYANDPKYVASGFAGENVNYKDHNGKDLKGDALTLRKFPTKDEQPKSEGKSFLGWTTKKLTGTPEEVTKQFAKLTEATKVEDVNGTENFKFTENTPIDKGITVYAAYGSPLVKFHNNANNIDKNKKDLVIEQPLKEQEITNKEVDLERQLDKTVKEGDETVPFKIEGYSLIGYTKDAEKAKTPLTSVPDENVTGSDADKSKDLYLRDGDTLKLTSDEVKDGIELYALWRPNYKVDVTKEWDNKELKTKNQSKIKVGLLTRPAVGTQGNEIVHPDAVYRPVTGTVKELSTATNGKLEWTNLPSYDENGHRMSYVAVELTTSTEKLFNNGDATFGNYGISITKPENSKYPSKIQLVNTDGVDAMSAATVRKHYKADGSSVDPHADGEKFNYFDTYGYSIVLTNKKVDIQPPSIEGVKNGQNFVVVKKNGDPSKLVVTLPDGKVATLVKNADGKLEKDPGKTTFTGNITVYEDGKITLTLPEGETFKTGEEIKAQQFKAVGDKEEPSKEVKRTVEQNDSRPVTEFNQERNDKDGNPVLEFTVPNHPLTPPTKDSEYTIGYVDGDNFIELDKVVLDEDMKSDSDTPVKKTFTIPKDKLDDGKKLVIRAKEKDGVGFKTIADSREVHLDTKAPTVEAKAQDELWRRWVNVDLSTFKEDSQVVVIQYNDVTGQTKTLRIDTREKAEETIEMLARQGFSDYKVSIEDKFGNAAEVKPTYKATKIIKIMIRNERIGKNYVQIRPYVDNTTVTVRIFDKQYRMDVRNKTAGYEDKAKVAVTQELTGKKYNKITLPDYTLTEGDIIEIIGTTPDGGITNPYAKVLTK